MPRPGVPPAAAADRAPSPPTPAPPAAGGGTVSVASGWDGGAASDDPEADRDAAPELAGPTASQQAAALDATAAGQFAAATQQVAAALSSLADPGSAPDPDVGVQASRTAGADAAAGIPGTVRTTADGGREVVVKLDPEHLGSVSIRLKMVGGKVDIAITVSDAHTLDVLTRDRHVLSAAVGAAGLGQDGLVLSRQPAAEPAASPALPDGAGGGSGRSPDGGASASSDPSGHRRRDDRNPARPPASSDAGLDDPQPVLAAQRSGALYV